MKMATKKQYNTEKSAYTSDEEKIKYHKKVAKHLETAAKYQLSTAKYYEEGRFDKALEYSNKSENEIRLANNYQKNISKDHKSL